jgi:L-asparaginase
MKTAPEGASPVDTRQTILVLTTGGTIDKQYFDALSRYQITDSVITQLLTVARVTHPYVIEEVLRKDSLDLTDEDRIRIVTRVRQAPFCRIVITHGTDTMTLTAQAFAEFTDRTIVLTGALSPARFTESDAAFNLGMAFATAQVASPGIYIAINGSVSLADPGRLSRRFRRAAALARPAY